MKNDEVNVALTAHQQSDTRLTAQAASASLAAAIMRGRRCGRTVPGQARRLLCWA